MDVARDVFSVLLVFSLLGVLLWALRRSGGLSHALARKRALGNSRAMTAVERLVLTPQHTLHIVRIHGREVLVATHPQGCTVVEAAERSLGAHA